jgi:hypothetical protein
MAWILEARELSPYYFLKRIMFDIYALQSECKKEALAGTNILTFAAETTLMENQQYLRENPLDAVCLNEGIYTVKKKNQPNALSHVVDINLKHCGACFRWDQSGVPCCHALAVLSAAGITTRPEFYTNCFHRLNQQATRTEMYRTCVLTGLVPDDNNVQNLKLTRSFQPLTPILHVDSRSSLTSKRIRSNGESTSGRAVKAHRKSKAPCPRCGKLLKDTGKMHDIRACLNAQRKKGGEAPTTEAPTTEESTSIVNDTQESSVTIHAASSKQTFL